MAFVGRTHRPVLNRDLCQRCGVCERACPAEGIPDFRRDPGTVRGYVYTMTDLAAGEALPPCRGACPLGQKVREYVKLLEGGRVKEALLTIREDNPLPGLCAHVCHHPCEAACLRGSWDSPVSIRELKRFAHQYEVEHRDEILGILRDRKEAPRGDKVSVIGAGPAGLACAFELVMAGYGVTVTDALDRPGGMLIGGIPSFRLPRRVIDHDVDMIRSLGVEFETGVRVGEDVTIREIRENADAVVVAVGAWKDLQLGIPGEGAGEGYETCLDFLGGVNLEGRRGLSGKVIVIGGGNAAMDTARSALRVGAEQVVLIYRRTREEMPASPDEVEEALREGVSIRYLEAPKRIMIEKDRVTGIELVKMKLAEPDESGRRRPVPIEGSEFAERADRIIPAIGQRPGISFLGKGALTEQGTVNCAGSGIVKGYEGVFAAGDALSGPSTVVEAAASGKRAAAQVREYLEGVDRG